MIIIDQLQTGLSKLQAIPVVGPSIFSPCKALLSTAQMIVGLAYGVLFGFVGTSAAVLGLNKIAQPILHVASEALAEAVLGFGSLFYACSNMATLGILGLTVVLSSAEV